MKRVILFLLALALWLHAAGFYKTEATVIAINGNSVTLSNPMPYSGMSALLLRDTPSGEFALAYLRVDATKAVIIDQDPLNGNPLATLQANPKIGDRVIGGFLYDRVLILAPNSEIEEQVKNHFGVESIESQLFKSYLSASGNSANASSYEAFAKLVGVGLIFLAKQGSVDIYDPITKKVIATESY